MRNVSVLQSHHHLSSVFERVSPLVAVMGDTVPVAPLFPAQIRENSKWSHSTPASHFDHHFAQLFLFSQVTHGTTDCLGGYTAHIVVGSRLQGTTAGIDCVFSTSDGVHVVTVVVWVVVVDNLGSPSVLSLSLKDVSCSTCYMRHPHSS